MIKIKKIVILLFVIVILLLVICPQKVSALNTIAKTQTARTSGVFTVKLKYSHNEWLKNNHIYYVWLIDSAGDESLYVCGIDGNDKKIYKSLKKDKKYYFTFYTVEGDYTKRILEAKQ